MDENIFQNTVDDFINCYYSMSDEDLSQDEKNARDEMLEFCLCAVKEYKNELNIRVVELI